MKNLSLDDVLNCEIDPAFKRRARIIIENLRLKNGDYILEVGCGRGYYADIFRQFFPDCKYFGVDINRGYLKVASNLVRSRNVNFVYGTATNLLFKNKSFDAVICTEVLEHLQDDKKALAEIYRVLKPGGIVLATVPNKNYPFFWDPLNWVLERAFSWHIPSNIWWLAGIWADHVRLYTEDELTGKVQSAGFTIQKVWRSIHFCLPFSHFLLYGVGKNLVEAGFLRSFNRFTPEMKKSFFLRLTLSIYNWFDRKNDTVAITQNDQFVNLILKAQK